MLTISPFTARQLAKDNLDLRVVPNPVSPQTFGKRLTFDPQASRRDLVLFWKGGAGLAEGIETIRALREQRPATTVTVWCRPPAHMKIARAALPRAEIIGDLSESDLCDLFLGHSLLLFPYTYEGFGMPPVEALACGCIPILRPDVGAAELYARDGFNSIFLNRSPGDLARRISSVLDNPDVLPFMRVNAPNSITPFNPEGYGQRLLEAAGLL
jgi:glycosyltransferase involved in cell wall biosynthesis